MTPGTVGPTGVITPTGNVPVVTPAVDTTQKKTQDIAPKAAQQVPAVSAPATTAVNPLLGTTSTPVVQTSDSVKLKADEDARKKLADEAAKQNELLSAQRDADIAKLRAEITPTTPEPVKPDYLKTYQELRASGGVQSLEDEMIAIKDRKRVLQDSLAEERTKLAGEGGITQGFLEGTMSEKGRAVQAELDKISRAEALAVDRLNLKNSYIDSVMKMTELDYSTASTQYNNEYSKNIQSQSLIANVSGKYETLKDKDETIARANLSTITNLFSNSGKTWDTATPEMKAQINKLEMQAGIPVGTTELFAKSKPRANIIGTTTGYDASGKQFTRYQYMDENGQPQMSDIQYTGGVAQTPTTPGTTEAAGKFATSLKSFVDDAYKGTYTREQVIAGLKTQYPEMKESMIEENVKALMPEGWEKNIKTTGSKPIEMTLPSGVKIKI